MPGYPIPRNRFSNHWMNASSIEAVFSQQGDEPRRAEGRAAHLGGGPLPHPLDQGKRLGAALAQRNQQAAARRELLHERRGDGRAAGGAPNRGGGGGRAPPGRPTAQQDRNGP